MGVRFISGGALTTIQDMGRFGYQETGMPVSGVMDQRSAALANLLVGNKEEEAVLEITMLGPSMEFTEDIIISVTGADLGAKLDKAELPRYQAVLVRAGQTVSFAGIRSGSRAKSTLDPSSGGMGRRLKRPRPIFKITTLNRKL